MSLVAVIDYGMGNLRSVCKALEHVAPRGTRVLLTGHAEDILSADRVVFPGQGAARDCMQSLQERNLVPVLTRLAASRPFLGICMGLQVLLEHSEENGGTDCLGLFKGQVRLFPDDQRDASGARLKIPHMGWNGVHQMREHPLWRGIPQDGHFYFVHSYYALPDDPELMIGRAEHGVAFAAAIARANVFAIQSHPEKSAASGLRLLENFMNWNGEF